MTRIVVTTWLCRPPVGSTKIPGWLRRALKKLEELGYTAILNPIEAPA